MNEHEETLVAIKEELKEIKSKQEIINNEIIKRNVIIMKRLNSIYENNEINDMRAKLLNREINKIKEEITNINKKMY